MRVRFTARARQRQAAVSAWWRATADHADLFDHELIAAIQRLQQVPRAGALYAALDGQEIGRLLLKRSMQHVHYAVDEAADEVVVHTIWGVRRGAAPLEE